MPFKIIFVAIAALTVIAVTFLFVNKDEAVVVPSEPSLLTYRDEAMSIEYPVGYVVNASHVYDLLGPGKELTGVRFTIPSAKAAGTNLSSDSYISVERIPQTASCVATLFLEPNIQPVAMVDGGVTYSVASSTGAAAGNRYEEQIFAIAQSNPCTAVRYFIHSGAIQNYPEGTVLQFDKGALLGEFDTIRRSLTPMR